MTNGLRPLISSLISSILCQTASRMSLFLCHSRRAGRSFRAKFRERLLQSNQDSRDGWWVSLSEGPGTMRLRFRLLDAFAEGHFIQGSAAPTGLAFSRLSQLRFMSYADSLSACGVVCELCRYVVGTATVALDVLSLPRTVSAPGHGPAGV